MIIGAIILVGTLLIVVGSSLLDSLDKAMSHSITGSVGQGPSIVVETDRGSVTVRRDSGAPLAAHNEKPAPEHLHPEIEKH